MKKFFGILSFIMFLCVLQIVGLAEHGDISLLVGFVMAMVACGAWIGCAYLAGAFEEYKEDAEM